MTAHEKLSKLFDVVTRCRKRAGGRQCELDLGHKGEHAAGTHRW